MKLLIIAGPYEADRVRRAVVSAGFEAVAVEPGESLAGWITASRPDLIVLAPQIVNADPEQALAKVRAVPRGRVPTFLVGEPEDEARMKDLADGFLSRPLSTADLVARVRERLGVGATGSRRATSVELGVPTPIAPTDSGSGEFAKPVSSRGGSGPGDGVVAVASGTPTGFAVAGGQKPLPTLKPLVSAADAAGSVPVPRARTSEAGALFVKLAESIDASLDAEMLDFARELGALRREPTPAPAPAPAPIASPPAKLTPPPRPPTGVGRRPPDDLFERTPMAPMTALAAAAALQGPAETTALTSPTAFDADDGPTDASRQKTVEVPRDVFAKMIADRIAATRDGGAAAGAPAPTSSGKLADGDVAAQFGRLFFQRLTGRLVLRRDAVEKVIFFDRGAPILGMSSDPDDRMGEMLVRQGRLTAEQLASALEGLSSAERRLGLVLIERGFIKASELPVVVRRHFEEIIHSAFAWEDGDWSLGPGQPTQEIVLLDEHPGAIILAGVRRKYGAARLARCLGDGSQTFRVARGAAIDDLLQHMAMTPEERGIVALFDGRHTLDEVRAVAGARQEVVAAIAWALSVLGQLDRVEGGTAAPADGAATNGAAAIAVAHAGDALSRPSSDRDRDRDRDRVLARYALVEEGDYFQVLDLPRGASQDDVRRAHDALMSALAPTSLPAALVAELGAELRSIRRVLDEALRVLGEPSMRDRYESHLSQLLGPAEHAAQ